MTIRLSDDPPEGNPRSRSVMETPHSEPGAKGLLSARSAAILGASFLIAVVAGVLTYLALGRSATGLAGAILAAGTAFAGAIRLLITIIA
jgi:hypothetical protein